MADSECRRPHHLGCARTVSPEAVGFLSAVGLFVILLVILFLFINKKLCFESIGGLPCLEAQLRRDKRALHDELVQSYGNEDCPRETSSDSDEEVTGKFQESRSQSIHSALYAKVVHEVPQSGQQASRSPHPAQRGDWSSEASDDEAHQWESRQRRYIGEVCARPLSSAHYRHGEYQYEDRPIEEDAEEYFYEEEEEYDERSSQRYYYGQKDIVEEDTTENLYSDEASRSPSLSHSPRLFGSERVGASLNDVPDAGEDANSQGSRGPEADTEMDQDGCANEGYNGGVHSESSAIVSTEEGSAQCSLSKPPLVGQEAASAVSSCGTLIVQMDFCKRTQKVSVLLEKVVNLLPRERTGATAWQVHLVLLPMKRQRFRSSVQRGDDLTFDETFRFSGIEDSELASYGVRFRLYAIRSINRERLMGESLFYMSRLVVDKRFVGGLRLEARSTINPNLLEPSPSDSNSSAHSLSYGGNPEILVGLSYNSTTGRLSVEIIKGSHFRNVSVSRQPDTYVKLTLQDSTGQEISQSKTSLRRGQPNPVYKETFVFQVALFQLSDMILTLSVFSKRSLKRKEIVGSVSLGANSRVEEERAHWDEMKESRGSQVCRWHRLQEV
uniref:synaptotagmin-14-like isoform X2 n=1 Tax=Myxine glutinosa TaxID=7769 RepID=UPI00358EDAF6